MKNKERERLFNHAIEELGSTIKGVVLRKMGDGTPSYEDVIGNIYLSIWIALKNYEKRASIRTFVYPIINNKINEHLRSVYKEREKAKMLLAAGKIKSILKYPPSFRNEFDKVDEPNQTRVNYELTPAEFNVFKLIGVGMDNGEIAKKLFISKNTVRTHLKKINTKLGFKSRVRLAIFANNLLNRRF